MCDTHVFIYTALISPPLDQKSALRKHLISAHGKLDLVSTTHPPPRLENPTPLSLLTESASTSPLSFQHRVLYSTFIFFFY